MTMMIERARLLNVLLLILLTTPSIHSFGTLLQPPRTRKLAKCGLWNKRCLKSTWAPLFRAPQLLEPIAITSSSSLSLYKNSDDEGESENDDDGEGKVVKPIDIIDFMDCFSRDVASALGSFLTRPLTLVGNLQIRTLYVLVLAWVAFETKNIKAFLLCTAFFVIFAICGRRLSGRDARKINKDDDGSRLLLEDLAGLWVAVVLVGDATEVRRLVLLGYLSLVATFLVY